MLPDNEEKPAFKERRFKLSRACDRCRRRRIKCDEGHPCQACLTANSACTFEEPGKRTHPHKSKRTATLEDRMHHLETLIQAIPSAVFAASGAAIPGGSSASHLPDSSASPLASFASSTHTYPSGVPPPSLHIFPLTNPSTHFTTAHPRPRSRGQSPNSVFQSMLGQYHGTQPTSPADDLAEHASRMSLSASYLYIDDEGYTRWQGETSGLPLLDLLVENHASTTKHDSSETSTPDPSVSNSDKNKVTNTDWFPNRTPRRTSVNPQTMWRLITTYIAPDLMDRLVQCYLCTSYYLIPFLHVPTFLADYGNPQKWGEPGFAAFIVAMCCLAARHTDDIRVRADPNEGVSAGTQWFELFGRLRTLPIADRPTLYTIQADIVAAVYAVGLGKLSKAAALLSEAVTVSVDIGLHRSADTYDLFDPIEDEIRKRTFWSVYIWDKQLGVHFGRPPMIRLRDCDVGEPAVVDDEFITRESLGQQPAGTESRMNPFVTVLRIMTVMESVVDVPPSRNLGDTSPFLLRASSVLSGGQRRKELREEEALLDDIHQSIPAYWAHSSETLASSDVIRITQAERLHCAEHYVRMLINRHRFSDLVAERVYSGAGEDGQTELEREATAAAHSCALHIVSAYLHIATKGLMTYYGVHVIHQLTQAGRTLIAVLLNCKSESLQPLIPPALDALRSCVGLLRRFSDRYICGQRSCDLMEEFCRLTQIPLEPIGRDGSERDANRPPWIRPVRKKHPSKSTDSVSQHSSPEGFPPSEFIVDMGMGNGAQSPPRINTSFNQSPRQPNSAHPASPAAHQSNQQFPLNGSMSPPGGGSSFMEPGNMGLDDASMYMSSADIMALLNDGGVDIASLFHPSPEFTPNRSHDGGGGASYGPSSPYSKLEGDSNGQESKNMMGLVSSP